jgi:acetyl-CoA carboxylase carboxyltransferase component
MAEIAVMGPEAAVKILHRREIAAAENPNSLIAGFVEDYRERFANPYTAAARGYVDAVIRPEETRAALIRSLHLMATKRAALPPKKHGNIPL